MRAQIASVAFVAAVMSAGSAEADEFEVAEQYSSSPVVAIVDLSDQTMRLYVDSELRYLWSVSTGVGADFTPTGEWNAYWLSPDHRSSLYNNAPMPWSVFYDGNYAVHGTSAVDLLGQPASHGCVRLETAHAEVFFRLVEAYGLNQSLVAVVE